MRGAPKWSVCEGAPVKRLKSSFFHFLRLCALGIFLSVSACGARVVRIQLPQATYSATFPGWTGVKALGPLVPAPAATDLTANANGLVRLRWNATLVSASSGTATAASYNVYRSLSAQSETFTSPLQTGVSAEAREYTDATASAGQTYYYNIAPVVSGQVVVPEMAVDREIRVIIPPENMVLLHRRMVNQEICSLMGKISDRENHSRCEFTGPGGNGTHFDQGADLFVDRYELGCNYSSTAGKCGSANGCIGILTTPNAAVTGDGGDIYYSRRTGACFLNTAASGATGTAWVAGNSATSAQRQLMGSSRPGLPPLVSLVQAAANDACSGLTAAGYAGTKRLLRRKELIALGAWEPTQTDAEIDTLENGINLDSTAHCNSNYASPQGMTTTDLSATNPTLAYDNSAFPAGVNRDTLPGCRFGDCASTASTFRSLRTGSLSTRNCVSRYGAQDVVGNVLEWASDQILCDGSTCAGLASGANPIDATNDDFAGVQFDGSQGPAVAGLFSSWSRIQFPLAVPIVNPSFVGDGIVARTAAKLYGDNVWLNTAASARGLLNGGSYGTSDLGGRFSLGLANAPTWTFNFFGSRCAISAE